MHRQEGEVEADEHRPEIPAAEPLVHHPAGDLGEPEIGRADHREDVDADQHVMEVGDDEIGVGQLPVDRHARGHEARDAADHEQQDHRGEEQEGGGDHRPAEPDRRDPGEDRDRARHRDDDRRAGEEGQAEARQAGREHVVHPDAEAEHHRRDGRQRDQAYSRPAAGGRRPAARPTPCPSPAARSRRPRDGRRSRTGAATSSGWPPLGRLEEVRAELAVHPEQEEGEADRRDDDADWRRSRSACPRSGSAGG